MELDCRSIRVLGTNELHKVNPGSKDIPIAPNVRRIRDGIHKLSKSEGLLYKDGWLFIALDIVRLKTSANVFGDVCGANDDIGGVDEQWACPETHFIVS